MEQQQKTMGDYSKRTDTGQISMDFQPANPTYFFIKNYMLSSLRDNQFDGDTNKDLWGHLAWLYETSSMYMPKDVTKNKVKLRLFSFSLTGRAYYCVYPMVLLPLGKS